MQTLGRRNRPATVKVARKVRNVTGQMNIETGKCDGVK